MSIFEQGVHVTRCFSISCRKALVNITSTPHPPVPSSFLSRVQSPTTPRPPVVTRMDTLKSRWTHYVYYTTRVFLCFLSYLMTPIMYFE